MSNRPPSAEEIKPGQFGRRAILTEAMTRKAGSTHSTNLLVDVQGNVPPTTFGRKRDVIIQTLSFPGIKAANIQDSKDVGKGSQFGRRRFGEEQKIAPSGSGLGSGNNGNTNGEGSAPFFGRRKYIPILRNDVFPEVRPAQFGRKIVLGAENKVTGMEIDKVKGEGDTAKPTHFGRRVPRQSMQVQNIN